VLLLSVGPTHDTAFFSSPKHCFYVLNVQLNCKNMGPEGTKNRHFEMQNRTIFQGRGHCYLDRPLPSGEGDTPPHTPPHRRLRRLVLIASIFFRYFRPWQTQKKNVSFQINKFILECPLHENNHHTYDM